MEKQFLNFELLQNEQAPIVIPKEERSKYFELLASCNTKGLAAYFEELERQEMALLCDFGFQPEPVAEPKQTERKKEQEPKL